MKGAVLAAVLAVLALACGSSGGGGTGAPVYTVEPGIPIVSDAQVMIPQPPPQTFPCMDLHGCTSSGGPDSALDATGVLSDATESGDTGAEAEGGVDLQDSGDAKATGDAAGAGAE